MNNYFCSHRLSITQFSEEQKQKQILQTKKAFKNAIVKDLEELGIIYEVEKGKSEVQ